MKYTATHTKWWHKAILVLAGLLLGLILVEAGLRIAGGVMQYMMNRENRITLDGNGDIRILCLGESTTALGGLQSYPRQLENIIRERYPNLSISVINGGIPGINTSLIFSEIENNIGKYHPDIIITMMGINDGRLDLVDSGEKVVGIIGRFFNNLRIWKLFTILRDRITYTEGKDRAREFRSPREKKLLSDAQADPGSAEKKRRLADWYLAQKRLDLAQIYYRDANKINPDDWKSELGIAFSHLQCGETDEALTAFRKALAKAEEPTMVLLEAGKLCREAGLYPLSEKIFENGLRLTPEYADIYLELDILLLRREEWAQADEYRSRGIMLAPEKEYEHLLRVGKLLRLIGGAWDLREQVFQRALEITPGDEQIYIILADRLANPEDLEEATRLAEKAVELNPGNPKARLVRGKCALRAGDWPDAFHHYHQAWLRRPWKSLHQLIHELILLKEFDRAELILKWALKFVPSEIAWNLLGASYLDQGFDNEARHCFANALKFRNANAALTAENYRGLIDKVARHQIPQISVQYPMRPLRQLQNILGDKADFVILVDNESTFKEAVSRRGYPYYFGDRFGGDFGHCTPAGNHLLATNIADVIDSELYRYRDNKLVPE